MKINIDCVRDILLTFALQKNTASKTVTQLDLSLDSYPQDTVTYHLHQIHNAHCATVLFSKTVPYNPKETFIVGLTNFGTELSNSLTELEHFQDFKGIIADKYPMYDLEIFSYAFHSYLSTKYGDSSKNLWSQL
ncbi:DUF2513 domain-containing protein [Erysipelothrix sp. HDW6C]|uniref:DUF2513 domain-containing protein n=1 Tax=Erysipelothrix sp. HDW6C TaxID=2714930 RepID=UPI00140C02A9|nr:DUF2513 domain-containing protein [Erysipelothrix sp. HDW6C]QIK69213.1 DUF2513 domain-containing protein [Erysipelothrix sp. HDW6C]